jgi:hypothetical protein
MQCTFQRASRGGPCQCTHHNARPKDTVSSMWVARRCILNTPVLPLRAHCRLLSRCLLEAERWSPQRGWGWVGRVWSAARQVRDVKPSHCLGLTHHPLDSQANSADTLLYTCKLETAHISPLAATCRAVVVCVDLLCFATQHIHPVTPLRLGPTPRPSGGHRTAARTRSAG